MKRLFIVLLFAILIFAFLAVSVSAATEEDKILEDFDEIIPDGIDIDTEDTVGEIGIDKVIGEVVSAISGEGSVIVNFFVLLFGFAVILSVTGNGGLLAMGGLGKSVEVAVSAIASVSIFTALYGVCTSVKNSLLSVVDFFSSLVPILTVISASEGATSTAAVQATNMNFTLALLEKVCTGALLPTSFAIFSLSYVGSMGEVGVRSVCRGIKSFFMWCVGIISAILAATVAMQGVVASAADNATLRAARYAATSMIPIVGSSVASALSTLGGGLAFVKGTVGAGAVVVILIITLSPLISLLLYRLAFSTALVFLEFSGAEGGVRAYSAFKAALDAVIAVYSMSTLVCIVELIVFLMGGARLT